MKACKICGELRQMPMTTQIICDHCWEIDRRLEHCTIQAKIHFYGKLLVLVGLERKKEKENVHAT